MAMLRLALIFLLIALVAGLFGFGVVASTAAEIATVIFWIFLILFGVSLVGSLISGRSVV
jgi:uncharacterized membrane protein YtjA (UPF0391 family)